MTKFLHNADAKAVSIPQVFSENSRAKNVEKGENPGYQHFFIFSHCFVF